MNGTRRNLHVRGASLMAAGAVVLALILSTCYWQPSERSQTGSLSVHVQIPPFVAQQGGAHALNYNGPAEFAILLFPEEVFQGPDGYTVFAYLMSEDPEGAWVSNLTPYATAIHHIENYTYGASGSRSFSNLPAGQRYTIMGWCWAEEEDANGTIYHEAMDMATVTIVGGQNQTVSLSLGDNYPKFVMAMLDYGVPIARAFQADGASQNTIEIGEVPFKPGGVGIELVQILQDANQEFVGFLHHLYIVESGGTFDFTKPHDAAVTGSDRIVRNEKKFVELALATEEALLFEEDWAQYDAQDGWPLNISAMVPGPLPYVQLARAWTGTQTESGAPGTAEDYVVQLSATETTHGIHIDFEEFSGSVAFDPNSIYLATWLPPEPLVTGIRLRVNESDLSYYEAVDISSFQYYQLLDATAYPAGSSSPFGWYTVNVSEFNNWYFEDERLVFVNADGESIAPSAPKYALPQPVDQGGGIWEYRIEGLTPSREWRVLLTTWEDGGLTPSNEWNGAALSEPVFVGVGETPVVELDAGFGYENTTAVFFYS